MEYNSFYGGRRGASFVIVKRYSTIQDMTADFGLGADFTQVNFDQYVIIDNVNKNDPDNGKIFRRGYDFDSDRKIYYMTPGNDGEQIPSGESTQNYLTDANGAEYVGTISGPSGKAPSLILTDIGNIRQLRYQNSYIYNYIASEQEKLKNDYHDYYLIVGGVTKGKYEDEQNALRARKAAVANIPGITLQAKTALEQEIQEDIDEYQELIDALLDLLPDLQVKIDNEVNNLNQYVYMIQDQTDPEFYQNGAWKWERASDGQSFIKYKIKLKTSPYDPSEQIYELRDDSLLDITDVTIDYHDSEYNIPQGIHPYDVDPFIDIVPGKYYTQQGLEVYNDVINYASITIPDPNGATATAWIGFKFPYLVNEFSTQSVDQYDDQGDYSTEQSQIERDDNQEHPFYEHWTISVPKGIHGTDVIELSVQPNNEQGYNGENFLCYKLKNYDTRREGVIDTDYRFICSYDSIESINVTASGLITINYTGTKDEDIYYLDLIRSIEIDHNNNRLIYHHTYWDGETDATHTKGQPYDTYDNFDYVEDILVDQYLDASGNVQNEAGTLYFKHNNNNYTNPAYKKEKYLKVIDHLQQIQPWQYDLIYNITDNEGHQVKDTLTFKYIDKFRIVSAEDATQVRPAGVYYHISNEPDTLDNYHYLGAIDIQEVDAFEGFDFDEETGQLYSLWSKEPYRRAQGDPITYPKTVNYDTTTGQLTVLDNNGNTITDKTLSYVTSIRYVNSGGYFEYQTVDNSSWRRMTIVGQEISYPTRFKYDKTTGKILYKKNTDSSAGGWTDATYVQGDELEYPTSLSYDKNTGIVTSTSNKGNVSDINTNYPIQYVTEINHHKISNDDVEYGLYTNSNLGNETGPIYTINKSANEIRLTSDFYIVAKYNDLDLADYDKVFGANWEYNKDDDNYKNKGWVNLGCPGKRIHEYDISLISKTDYKDESKGIPLTVKTGGIAFIVEAPTSGSQPYIPVDYYDPDRVNQIDEETPEICEVSQEDFDKPDFTPPQNLADGGIMFIVIPSPKWTILLDQNYEDADITSVQIEKGATYSDFPIPIREGYTFLGWFTQSEGGEQVTSYIATEDITFYAQWQEEQQSEPEPQLQPEPEPEEP